MYAPTERGLEALAEARITANALAAGNTYRAGVAKMAYEALTALLIAEKVYEGNAAAGAAIDRSNASVDSSPFAQR